jgi:secreted PhoX family phosphatase
VKSDIPASSRGVIVHMTDSISLLKIGRTEAHKSKDDKREKCFSGKIFRHYLTRESFTATESLWQIFVASLSLSLSLSLSFSIYHL